MSTVFVYQYMRGPVPRRPVGKPIPYEPVSDTGAPVPFPPDFSFPFLQLPPELRRKIYRLLFRSDVPLYPAIRCNQQDAQEILKRTSFPTHFLRVSRQIEAEATEVLWGENQIVFQFPLKWDEEPDNTRWYARCQGFIPKSTHLLHIQDLVVEAYLVRSPFANGREHLPVRPRTEVERGLRALCDILTTSSRLRTCEIRFSSEPMRHSPNEICATFLKSHGSFHQDPFLAELHRLSMKVDQQVLGPLTSIRGLQRVTVVGGTTSRWAEYLKKCMTADPGDVIEEFEHIPLIEWASKRKGTKRKR